MNEILYQILFGAPDAILAGPAVAFIPALISAAASIGSAFMSRGQSPSAVSAPKEDQMAKANAEQRQRNLNSRGFSSTILSDLSNQYGLKNKLGA